MLRLFNLPFDALIPHKPAHRLTSRRRTSVSNIFCFVGVQAPPIGQAGHNCRCAKTVPDREPARVVEGEERRLLGLYPRCVLLFTLCFRDEQMRIPTWSVFNIWLP